MAFYPLFCAWIQEMLPCATSPQEAYLAMEKRLRPILISALARHAHFYDIDVDDCRDEVFRRMERKLGEPIEFNVKLARGVTPFARVISVLPGAVHASFLFELFETVSSRLGYKVRLRTGDGLVWEEDCPAERIDSRSGRLPINVPAKKLQHGQSYTLQLECALSGGCVAMQEFHTVHVRALHLLRADSFTIIGHHTSLDPSREYQASFRKMHDNAAVATLGHLTCSEKKTVSVSLDYAQLGHEQDTHMELSRQEDPDLGYFACVRAVQYKSLKNRMGFVVQMARTVALERSGRERGVRGESLESLPLKEHPVTADKGQDTTVLLARSAIERLPARDRGMLIDHELRGWSWVEIARRQNVSEAKVKQDVSRALKKVTEAIRSGATQPDKGASRRIVDWLKDMLEDIFRDGKQ
jgi:hypothetical protein